MSNFKKSYFYKYNSDSYPVPINCNIIYSNRKSISIQINKDKSLTIRCPYFLSESECIQFIQQKNNWIVSHLKNMPELIIPSFSEEQLKQIHFFEKKFRNAAKEYIPKRVAYFHQFTGGNYTSITIRDQKSRWGSCSSRGTLSFNYRLMLASPEILDYVIVHELCHLTHMNHSKSFWEMVESILPDYKIYKSFLKDHGHELTIEYYLFSLT